MIRPSTYATPGLPKEWNALIDKSVGNRKKRDREEMAKHPKRKKPRRDRTDD